MVLSHFDWLYLTFFTVCLVGVIAYSVITGLAWRKSRVQELERKLQKQRQKKEKWRARVKSKKKR